MHKKYNAFALLFALAVTVSLYRLKSAPLWIAVAILPTIALFAMLQWQDGFARLRETHWLRRFDVVNEMCALVRRALNLPQSMRMFLLAGCLAWCCAIVAIVMPIALSA